MTKTVFKEGNVTFQYDITLKELYQKWDGFVDSGLFRKAVDKVLDLSEQYVIYYIVSDTTTHSGLSQEDSEYASDLMPLLFENGIKFAAFILSKNILSRMSVDRFTDIDKSEINIGRFNTIAEARKWVANHRF